MVSFEEAVAVMTENPGVDAGSTLDRAARVYNAMQELNAAGFRLLLLPPDTSVRIRKSRHQWWRASRREREQ